MPDRVTVCSPEFSLIARLPKAFKVGGTLKALTVTMKVRLTVLLIV